MEQIKKSDIGLKRTDLANMFNAYMDENNNSIFYMGRTLSFGNVNKLNEKFVTRYNWKDEDNWYKVSYMFYSDHKLWWIICRINGITNPFEFPEAGSVIAIPSQGLIDTVLNKILT